MAGTAPHKCVMSSQIQVVHQPASPSIWPAVQSLRRGLSTNPGVIRCAYVGVAEDMMFVVCVSVTEGA